MEKSLIKIFGVIWIIMALFLSFIIIQKPSESGIAIGFLLMSISMAWLHLSGMFNPPEISTTAQPR